MKVAMCMRRDFRANPGGDCIQAFSTAKWLEKKHGVEVHFLTNEDKTTEDFDLYHIFNLTRISSSFEFAKFCINSNKPYVLSPIWHSVDMMRSFYEPTLPPLVNLERYFGLRELFYERDRLVTSVLSCAASWKKAVTYVVNNSSYLLPNSHDELSDLSSYINFTLPDSSIVPNGLDIPDSIKNKKANKKKYYVCSGRVEPRKNTELVVRAFLNSNAPSQGYYLLILGAPSSRHEAYFRKVMALVDGVTIQYTPAVPHDIALSIYKEAYGMIHASHFETTGLVALEALNLGCKVVMTEATYADPYFLDYVEYCKPNKLESIISAINNTLSFPLPSPNDTHFEPFFWEKAADLTYSAYLKLKTPAPE